MNMQPVVQTRSSANGFGNRRVERDTGNRQENKLQFSKSNPSRSTVAGVVSGSNGCEGPSRDRLVYLTTCLIGHHVDVQVKDGSVYTGIFHATNTEKDFGIILKMARLTKEVTSRGHKASSDTLCKAPSKTLIIPANEVVQVIAKDVSVTRDEFSSDLTRDKEQEIMIDSYISHSRHAEAGRELERWVPDEDDSQCPELENIFDGQWNRKWDQFQANEALFGVTSTFDEELYTTKLERGPQMRELEREALRIAREIESEETQNMHLAEERGKLHDDFNFDEETRFSSVLRGVDDSGYNESDDGVLDSHNFETFESSANPISNSRAFSYLDNWNNDSGALGFSSSSSMVKIQDSQSSVGTHSYRSGSNDQVMELISDSLDFSESSYMTDSQCGEQKWENNNVKESLEKKHSAEDAQVSEIDDLQSSLSMKKNSSDKGGLSSDATAFAPLSHVFKGQEHTSTTNARIVAAVSSKIQDEANSRRQPSNSTSTTSEYAGAKGFSVPGLSPSSSVGSLSSERSTLNPHAKEFRLNPNAKSYVPFQTPARPASPAPEGSFYYQSGGSAVPHIPGLPVGIGIGPTYAGHQPVIYNPQAAAVQSSQPYFFPNGPQYGQQMNLGHPRQVMYMPGYPPEMQYKGRDY